VDLFDEQKGLFLALGMNEHQATVAAIGRAGSEAEARRVDADLEAEELADRARLAAEASVRSEPAGVTTEMLRGLQGAMDACLRNVPTVVENYQRRKAGLAPRPLPWRAPGIAAPAAPTTEAVVAEAVTAVQDRLRMAPAEASAYVQRLHSQEARRGGSAHADRYVQSFAGSLRSQVREVAPR
jgi:hypothetical protein